MVDVPIGAAEVEVEMIEHPPEVVEGVIEPLVSGVLVILLVMSVVRTGLDEGGVVEVVAPAEEEDVEDMLIGLLTGVALESDIERVVLTALTLESDEAEDAIETEELEEEVAVTTLALTVDEAAVVETKISSYAPPTQPIPALYPGLTPSGGSTLSSVAWFHAIICFAPETAAGVAATVYGWLDGSDWSC